MEKTHPSPHFHPHYAALARPWSFRRNPESRGEGWHQPHPNTSNDQVSFSYLGVPAAAGMSDCYEHGRPPAHAEWAPPSPSMGEGWGEGEARSVEACPQPMARRPTILIPAAQFVIPAKAGIQGRGMRGENDPQTPPPTSALNLPVSSFRPPNSSFPRKRESRGGARGATRKHLHQPAH